MIDEIIARRKNWLKEIETQDNRCTAHPIIIALQLAREHACREDCDDPDGTWEPDEDKCITGPTPFKIFWEDEQHFFTYSALKDHLRRNKHNYPKTRDFVKHAFRNPEWADIISDFKALIEHLEKNAPKQNEAKQEQVPAQG